MKLLIVILALILTTSAFSQIAPPRKAIALNLPVPSANQSNMRIGPAMMIGGAAFVLAGALTPPTMVGWSTTEKQPFYKQIRMLPILTGTIVFTIGAGNALAGN